VETPEDDVAFWRKAGYDFVSMRSGVRSVVRGFHPVVKAWQRARATAADEEKEGWVTRGIVRNRGEFEAFPWPEPKDLGGYNDYADMDCHLKRIADALPSDMKVLAQLGYIFMGAWQLMGFENFCFKLTEDPDLVKDVIDKLGASQMAVLEMLLQHDAVGIIWMPDDLCFNSGPLVAPRVYERYIYPWYVHAVERCHAANIPIGLHSDGDLTKLLPGLINCGFDAIHPFEPPTNDIVAIKRRWGHRIAVAGNIDLTKTLCDGSPEDVEAEVREKAAQLSPGGGWLVGSSNSIPDFVPLENYRALLAASLTYGRYEA
jgi:uroporphyrinogen decarboxylase